MGAHRRRRRSFLKQLHFGLMSFQIIPTIELFWHDTRRRRLTF